jgi:hypothetical protein
MKTALVVTSINAPNQELRAMAEGATKQHWDFVVVGDSKTPLFELEGCRFLSLEAQRNSTFKLGKLCPENTYARKNLGYLDVMRLGAEVIVETDDDNHPEAGFWAPRQVPVACKYVDFDGWVNTYAYFYNGNKEFIYPRGLPLPHARDPIPDGFQRCRASCLIQQGLANGDPDVDAVYRMTHQLPFWFEAGEPVFLGEGAWCPFNSQNTTWFREAFPLLYLPTYCSFRMCDIWRSFVAQRIMPGILFHSATVYQNRNEHDLHKDFLDEIPGYVNNDLIRTALLNLEFREGWDVFDKMTLCYATLVDMKLVKPFEMELLRAWISDVKAATL